jgi:hypothetical protein
MRASTMQDVIAPERTLAQRMEALKEGNETRLARAQWKRDVKAGRVDPHAQLLNPEPDFMSMMLLDYLLALPYIGRTKAKIILTRGQVSACKTLGGLTARQRGEVHRMVQR